MNTLLSTSQESGTVFNAETTAENKTDRTPALMELEFCLVRRDIQLNKKIPIGDMCYVWKGTNTEMGHAGGHFC